MHVEKGTPKVAKGPRCYQAANHLFLSVLALRLSRCITAGGASASLHTVTA